MAVTIQFIEPIPGGIRFSSEYDCESLEEAEERAVSMTSGGARDSEWNPYLYEVAIIRRNDIVMARYFHTIQIP